MKFVLILGLITLVTFTAGNTNCHGCPRELEGDELKECEDVIQNSLRKLAADNGPSYELVKIISGTRQLVAGTLDEIKAELKNQRDNKVKVSEIEIWSRPWLENGTRVTYDIPDEEQLVTYL